MAKTPPKPSTPVRAAAPAPQGTGRPAGTPAAKPPAPAIIRPGAEMLMSVDHYRRGYHAALGAALLLSVATVLAATVAIIALQRPVRTRYFATSPNGRIVRLRPLTAPLLDRMTITNLAATIATRLYTLDYAHLRRDVARSRPNMLPTAYQSWRESISQKLLPSVAQERLIVSAVPKEAPTLLGNGVLSNAGPLSGHYGWSLRIPLIVTYLGVQGQVTQKVTIKMLLVRENPDDFAHGVAVASLSVQ